MLEKLLAPVKIEHFISDVFEKEVLHLGGEVSCSPRKEIADSISGAFWDTLWSKSEDLPKYLKAVKGVSHEAIYSSNKSKGEVQQARDLYRNGWTIAIAKYQDFDSRVHRLCRIFEEIFATEVSCTTFLTPPNSQGFSIHYDTSEVFAIQCDGEKKWFVKDQPCIERPAKSQSYNPSVAELCETEDDKRFLCKPGDLIYIPRGFPHYCKSDDKPSLHMSLVFYPNTEQDLLKTMVDIIAEKNSCLRLGTFLNHVRNVSEEDWETLKKSFLAELTFENYIKSRQRLNQKSIGRMAPFPPKNFDTFSLKDLEKKYFIKSAGQISCLTFKDNYIVLTHPGLGFKIEVNEVLPGIAIPSDFSETVSFLNTVNGPFSLDDLPGNISLDSKKVLVSKFVKTGFLEFHVEH